MFHSRRPAALRLHPLVACIGLGLLVTSVCRAEDPEPPLGVNVLENTFKWRPNYVSDDMLMHADKDANNWLHYGKDYQNTRFSALTQITTENVKKLVPTWNLSFGVNEAQDSQTTVINGRVFVTASQNKVFALDGVTGKMLWKYERSLPGDLGPKLCCDAVNRGVALYKDMVFMATLDTHVVALNSTTGTRLPNSSRRAMSTPGVDGPPMNLCGDRKIASLYAAGSPPTGAVISMSTYGAAAAKSQNASAPCSCSSADTPWVSETMPVTLDAALNEPIFSGRSANSSRRA